MEREKMKENIHIRKSRNNTVYEKIINRKHVFKTFLHNSPFETGLILMIFIRLNHEEIQYYELICYF